MAELEYLTKEEMTATFNHIDECMEKLKKIYNDKANYKKKDLSSVSYMKEGDENGDESL